MVVDVRPHRARELASWFEGFSHARQRLRGIGEVLQALVAVGAIEGAQSGLVPRGVGIARVREVEGDGREWGRVGGGAERGVALARHLEHAPGGVQRHHAAGAVGGADLAGEDVRARAGAGGEVEHHVLGRGETQLHQRLHPRDEHLSPRALVVPPGVVRREPARGGRGRAREPSTGAHVDGTTDGDA